MAIADDWTINYGSKTITHTANTTVYTVLALYSWLMDVFDDAAQMDDDVPMSAQTPTAFTLVNGWSIPETSYQYLKGGAVTDTTNDDVWSSIYTLGTIVAGSQVYVIQDGAEITPFWSTGHIDILVRTKESGTPIDNGKLLFMIRDLLNTFDHYEVDCSAGGRNVVPLATAIDLNNQTASGTIAAYTGIVPTFGTVSKDLNNGNGSVNYDVSIACGGHTLVEVYEYLKYISRHNSASTLNGSAGDIYLSAVDGYTEVKAAPFGTFAGGKFFGARGVWIEGYDSDDAKNFQLIDASGTTQTPPNVIPVKVTGVIEGATVAVYQLSSSASGLGEAAAFALIDSAIISPDVVSGGTAQTTLTYSSNIPTLVVVRKKGYLPFWVASEITATGMSVAAIATVDGIVS